MKLANTRCLGRYHNHSKGKTVNIHTGRRVARGVDIMYYLYRGTRIYVSDREFHQDWKKIS